MDKQELHLEEYRILLTTISHIFWEFWWGNAFFVSFFSVATGALVANLDRVDRLPTVANICLAILFAMIGLIWIFTNARHNHYLGIHMKHAVELEEKYLGCSIFSRRMMPAKGLARVPVRKLWIIAPIAFVLIDVIIVVTADPLPFSQAYLSRIA